VLTFVVSGIVVGGGVGEFGEFGQQARCNDVTE